MPNLYVSEPLHARVVALAKMPPPKKIQVVTAELLDRALRTPAIRDRVKPRQKEAKL